jgi:hypothetical protein
MLGRGDTRQLIQLTQAVEAGAKKLQEAHIAQYLELLADFGLDVVIVGVEFLEGVFESVDFGELEFGFTEGADGVEDI